jgi:YEATS domain-containing protein 4
MERHPKVSVSKPIIYGTMSLYQGKKADENNSHKWVCYVRPVNDEDLSTFIEKVNFQLHPSFTQPNRTCTRPPFEMYESGWGEFEICIQIYFKDTREKRLDILHLLRLYPTTPGASQSTKKPVVSEFYDEIIFNDPSPDFYDLLHTTTGVEPDYELLNSAQRQDFIPHFTPFSDASVLSSIEEATAFVKSKSSSIRDNLRVLEAEISNLRQDLRQEERKQQ